MPLVKYVSLEEVFLLCKQLALKIGPNARLYGVPRGGVPVAMMLFGMVPGAVLVERPEDANYIIDDIIDSGVTRSKFPCSRFIALFKKPTTVLKAGDYCGAESDAWVVFPWEGSLETSAEDIFTRFLQFVGEDITREGLRETPKRMAKAWEFWTSGYSKDPDSVFKTFADGGEKCDEMIVVSPIPFHSHCVVGSTFVETPKGRIPIKYLKDGDWVYTVDPETKELETVRCVNPRLTKKNADLVRVYSDNDTVICTPDHRFLTHNRSWVEAKDLLPGDSVISLYRSLSDSNHVNLIASRSTRWAEKNGAIQIDGEILAVAEHQFIFGKMNELPIRGQNGRNRPIHHKNEVKWDNTPTNLERLSIQLHNQIHDRFNGETNIPGSDVYEKRKEGAARAAGAEETRAKKKASAKAYWDNVKMDPAEYQKRCNQTSNGIQLSGRNHKIIGVEEVPWKEDVYCMNVPGTQTFFANGMAVHNCEHHMAAIFGDVYIGYIPNDRIVGLSKFARVVDIFARRLQVQERLTTQIADTIEKNLKPMGVAVYIEARHFCMESRGVQKSGVSTKTSAMRGVFHDDNATKAEFFQIIK